ncbi:MAG: sulfotransferase domain-containing protein [Myxococcota bacterium]
MNEASRPQRTRCYQNVIMDGSRWDHFRPREGDIVISTSYKAGTTWLQGICAALVFQEPEPPVAQDELSPWIDALFAPIDEVIKLLEGLESRRYIKTHLPLDGMRFFDEVRYIVVGRDGRDVFASMWNHWNNMVPEKIDEANKDSERKGPRLPHPPDDVQQAFDNWLSKSSFAWEQDGYPFWSHLHHAQTWWDYRHLDNVLHVHFEDLLADLDGEMRRISEYLDIPVDESRWRELVHGVTFDQMKGNADKMAPGATVGLWKDNSRFFHKGTSRRWEGLLRPDQSARYEEVAKARLEPALASWLVRGRKAVGDPKQI